MTGANCKSFETQAQWAASGNQGPFLESSLPPARLYAAVPTAIGTWLTAPALPSPALSPTTALPGCERLWDGRSLLVRTPAARIPEHSYFLPCAPALGTSPKTARRQPAQQTFFPLSFPFNKTALLPTNFSSSLAQILALLNQIQAARAPWFRSPGPSQAARRPGRS